MMKNCSSTEPNLCFGKAWLQLNVERETLSQINITIEAMAIEIVDFPIEHGEFPLRKL